MDRYGIYDAALRTLTVNGFNRRPRIGVMDGRRSKIRIWKKLRVEHEGHTLVGSYAYTATDQIVEVRSLKGERKATHLGRTPPESLARLMLIELADEGKA
jgi:hypothetical protein